MNTGSCLVHSRTGRGRDCTYCKNRIGSNSCINKIVKFKQLLPQLLFSLVNRLLKRHCEFSFFLVTNGRGIIYGTFKLFS